MTSWQEKLFSPAGAAVSAGTLFLIAFGDIILQRQIFIGADVSAIHLPYRIFFADTLRAGSFPFWCKEIRGGFPLFVAYPALSCSFL